MGITPSVIFVDIYGSNYISPEIANSIRITIHLVTKHYILEKRGSNILWHLHSMHYSKSIFPFLFSLCVSFMHWWSIAMTSLWVQWRLKLPASRLFTQPFIRAQIKVNIKAPRHWPLCGEFTGTGELPAQMACNAENVSIWWRHHDRMTYPCLIRLLIPQWILRCI